jgi:hypothetical protein
MRSAYVITLLLSVTGCGLKKRIECTATATYEGKPRTATGSDFEIESKAKATSAGQICPKYCTRDDATVDAAIAKAKVARGNAQQTTEEALRASLVSEPEVRPLHDARRCQVQRSRHRKRRNLSL